mgnify:FL=1
MVPSVAVEGIGAEESSVLLASNHVGVPVTVAVNATGLAKFWQYLTSVVVGFAGIGWTVMEVVAGVFITQPFALV